MIIRIDENISFTNIDYIEAQLYKALMLRRITRNIVLIFTSVSEIDTTAVDALEALTRALKSKEITRHLFEVKGSVMDKLKKTDF